MAYNYRVTIEALNADSTGETIEYEVQSHDDLSRIVNGMKGSGLVAEAEITKTIIAIKLFGEVILKNRATAPFKNIMPHFKDFMKHVKASAKDQPV